MCRPTRNIWSSAPGVGGELELRRYVDLQCEHAEAVRHGRPRLRFAPDRSDGIRPRQSVRSLGTRRRCAAREHRGQRRGLPRPCHHELVRASSLERDPRPARGTARARAGRGSAARAARYHLFSGTILRRYHRLHRREVVKRRAVGAGGIRRAERADCAGAGSATGSALRLLRRFRRDDESENRPPVAAGAIASSSVLVGDRISRAHRS